MQHVGEAELFCLAICDDLFVIIPVVFEYFNPFPSASCPYNNVGDFESADKSRGN